MSKEVKRYDSISNDGACGMMIEDADYGTYVEYADYDALLVERDRLESLLVKTTTRHFAQHIKDRADGKRLDECLSEGVAMLEAERDQLLTEVKELRVLLSKSLPIVEAHAGASHMLEGFRPKRNKWDDLVDGISAALTAKDADKI